MKVRETKFNGIYRINGNLATVNLTPGERVYGERLVKIEGKEYRFWSHWRSKPAAAIKKKLKVFPLKEGQKILYLGIASGTTASHFSDIVKEKGLIYGVEISERILRELIPHAEKRGNIIPILADAKKPKSYNDIVFEKVDLVYEDVADPDMIKILIWNCEEYLKSNGYAIIAIKSQSISSTKPPRQIYKECLEELGKHFDILDRVELDPYEKKHLFVVMRFKK
jgi:fibrillarin-like pre-rRNA processing protein